MWSLVLHSSLENQVYVEINLSLNYAILSSTITQNSDFISAILQLLTIFPEEVCRL